MFLYSDFILSVSKQRMHEIVHEGGPDRNIVGGVKFAIAKIIPKPKMRMYNYCTYRRRRFFITRKYRISFNVLFNKNKLSSLQFYLYIYCILRF